MRCMPPRMAAHSELLPEPTAPQMPTIMVVMEYVEGGPVQEEYEDETELLSELVARGIFRQLLLGLRHIHSKGVIHGDVKPANLAFGGDGVVKLIDFGSSVVCKQVRGVIEEEQAWVMRLQVQGA